MATQEPNDACKSAPGQHARDIGCFAPMETRIFLTILNNSCTKLHPVTNKPQLVVDVGGNIGYFALYAASFGCRVITIEPNPAMYQYIQLSSHMNGFTDQITMVLGGVSDQHGSANLTIDCQDTGLTHFKHKRNIEAILYTLDEIISEDVLLLKIDVEGYEDSVFKGMTKLMNISHIICETKANRDVAYKRKFMNEGPARGYTIFTYNEQYGGSTNLNVYLDPEELNHLGKLGDQDWIPAEDTWYIKDYAKWRETRNV